jgi:signal transduction histidine kinase
MQNRSLKTMKLLQKSADYFAFRDYKSTYILAWITLGICVLPVILEGMGVDFSSPAITADLFQTLPTENIIDTVHIHLAGSFIHTILEWSAFCAGLFTAILAFVYFILNRDVVTPIIGISLFYAGCMDAFHTLAADRLIAGVANSQDLIPFTWAICRVFSGLILIIGVSLFLGTKRSHLDGKFQSIALISVICGVVAYGTILVCVRTEHLPQTMFPTALITRPWDVVPLVLFAIAGLFLFPRFYHRYPSFFSQSLIISTIPQIATQIHMAFGSTRLFDSDFNIAHFLKIIAYLIPFIGLCFAYVEINIEKEAAEQQLRQRQAQLETALQDLKGTQAQLIQSEKMSSLGQLVGGIAHEINNPVNFIYGNLIHAQGYVNDLKSIVALYQQYYPDPDPLIQDVVETVDLPFILSDFPDLLQSMQVGAKRIQEVVDSLRNFSRLDESDRKECDIHEGLESTLLFLKNRLKHQRNHAEITIKKDYDVLPLVECYPSHLNQVFLSLLENAIDTLETKAKTSDFSEPCITIQTRCTGDRCLISIRDNGMGMSAAVMQKIFDPFFTTKGVGQGTGLGLAVSYSIIHDQHHGTLSCQSDLGQGSEFQISIPLRLQRER